MALETFFACFWPFHILTQIIDFARAIAHALSEIFPADFGTLAIIRILGVLRVDFCVEHCCCGSRDVFWMFLNISIFDPNWRFCKGYSPCSIANFSDFGTLVIFQILGFCWSGFLHSTNLLWLWRRFQFNDGFSVCMTVFFFDFGTIVT